MRIEKLKAAFTLDVRFVHFPLHPETPEDGRSLEDLFRGRGVDVAASQERLKRLAQSEGLPYGDRTMTYNSRLAQELGAWADSTTVDGRGERLHDALFRAYFVDGVNLARQEQLVALAEDVGLDPAAAADVLAGRTFRDAVDKDWQRSRDLGVTGVPTYVAGGNSVVGAQPYEVLEELVVATGARRRRE